MRVQDFKAKPKRSTESAVETAFARTWKDLGIYSRHMSDAVPGLPDRYVQGGRWVEFKSLYRVRGEFTVGEGLSPEQIRCCSDLAAAGDRVFYCAQLDGWARGKRYLFMPWKFITSRMGLQLPEGKYDWPATAEIREQSVRMMLDALG